MLASITYENNLEQSIKLKLNSDSQAEPVPRVAISFPAMPKILLPTEKGAVQIGIPLLLHGISHTVSGLHAIPAQQQYIP